MKLASEPLAERAAMVEPALLSLSEMMNGSFRDPFMPTMSWHCQHGTSEDAKYPQDFPTGIF
ncbi:MAG: hypothetical protein LKG62_06535 [Solobacterium sp.]|jgi:hypothetical protein|nr:hypothetical protein [Solobacterium sp.]